MLKLYLLGPFQVTLDDQLVDNFVSDKARALLIYLAVSKRPHSREALAGLLWAEDTQQKAKNSLRVALANVRKLLPGSLMANRQTVQFDPEMAHWLDIAAFDWPGSRAPDTQMATADLQAKSRLYRAEFLKDFQTEGMPAFYEWILGQRAYYNEKALVLLSALAERQTAAGAFQDSVQTLRRLLELEPWNEKAQRTLMIALSSLGDYNGALAQYEAMRSSLEQELGVAPAEESQALYERIIKLRSGRPNNLPGTDSPFIGRQDEIKRIKRLLFNPDCRLVTITGIGGLGKTRLALAAGQHLLEGAGLLFSGGITYIPLQGVEAAPTAADALATAVAQALKLFIPGRRPPSEEVIEYLEEEEQLLIFDNFEHLIEGADWIAQIFPRCPGINILITSREPLNLAAEWRFILEGLPYPSASRRAPALSRSPVDFEAVQLFLQAAEQARPGFQLTDENSAHVVRICQQVMGMPLAIKLVASWLRVMPTEQLNSELQRNLDILQTNRRDVPDRQRSMRAVFDSTWIMLSDQEQRVLSCLSVFRGGFSAAAAEELISASPFLLAGLQDRGLLQFEAAARRYVLHELLRQFAAEKLAAQGSLMDQMHAAHSHYFGRFMADQVPKLVSPKIGEALSQIDLEISNIRAGWRRAIRTEDDQELPDLAAYGRALRIYFLRRGLYHEGMAMCRDLVERINLEQSEHPTALMKNLQGAANLWVGIFYYNLGELEGANRSFQRSIDWLTGQDPSIPFTINDFAGVHHMLGQVQQDTGQYEAGKLSFEEAERLDSSLGVIGYAAKSSAYVGILELELGNIVQAGEKLAAIIPVLRTHNDFYYGALALGGLAQVLSMQQKPFAGVLQALEENLQGSRGLKSPVATALTLLSLGSSYTLPGEQDLDLAQQNLQESRRIFGLVSAAVHLSRVTFWLGWSNLQCGEFRDAQSFFLSSVKMSSGYGLWPLVIANLNGLALVDQQSGKKLLSAGQMQTIAAMIKNHPASSAVTKWQAQGWVDQDERLDSAIGLRPFADEIAAHFIL